MQYPQLKSPAKAQIEQSNNNKREKAIKLDQKKIDEALVSNDVETMRCVHMHIDGKYGAYVPDWYKGMFGYFENFGFDHPSLLLDSLINNLNLMKSKLEGFELGFEKQGKRSYSPSNSVNVNVSNTNEINVTVSFEQARQQIEDMTSLTEKETEEILAKIAELEEIINSKDKKKTKWEKSKSVLLWLADKSFDVGMTLLPLLLKLQG